MTEELTLFDFAVPEEPGTDEDIDDLEPLSERDISQAVVYSTDWTTETIITQINKGNILLNPKFQRRDAWEGHRKSRFIESLILGFPIPQLVLAESRERKGAYLVIDGKQRLLSIRQFAAGANDPLYTRLRLSGLAIRKDLARKSLEDLRSDTTRYDDLAAFENQPIRTVVIKNWPDENFLYHVFLRLNTGSVPLSPQELRQALHPGPFVDYADLQSGESPALRQLLKLKRPDFRMRDVELLIRFYAFRWFLTRYTGDLKRFLDITCMELNAAWPDFEMQLRQDAETFENAYKLSVAVFGETHVFRKWTGNGYEKRFNRAIFDIVLYAFSDGPTQQIVLDRREEVEGIFKDLCATNPDFLSAIERTTKSLEATTARLSIWASTLNDRIGSNLRVPQLVGGRIMLPN